MIAHYELAWSSLDHANRFAILNWLNLELVYINIKIFSVYLMPVR